MRTGTCCLLLAMVATGASAGVHPIDDAATIVHGGTLAMRWRSTAPGPRSTTDVDGRIVVSLSLDTRPWVGRRARIFMSLVPQAVPCRVAWTTRGRVLPGRLEPGERALVFDGVVPGPTLTDTLEIGVSADGRELMAAQQLRFSLAIEVQP